MQDYTRGVLRQNYTQMGYLGKNLLIWSIFTKHNAIYRSTSCENIRIIDPCKQIFLPSI